MFLPIVLSYFIVILFIWYTYNTNKPIKYVNLFKMIKFNYASTSNKLNGIDQIPGPMRLLFLGTRWILWNHPMSKLHELYKRFQESYGDIVLEVTSSGVQIVHLFDRKDIETVLSSDSKYPFRPPTEITNFYRETRQDRYVSAGLVNAQGEQWAFLRAKLTPKLQSRKSLIAFYPTLNQICDDFIDCIRKRRNENNVVKDFEQISNLMSLESTCCLILGRRMGYLCELNDHLKDSDFMQLSSAVKSLFKTHRDSYYGFGLWRYFPTKTYKEFVRNEETIYRIISNLVEKSVIENNLECDDSEINSIFVSILKTDNLDMREKISAIIDFITAGIELMSHTLCFVLYFVSMDQGIQDKLYKEVSELNEHLTYDDLRNATYTRAAIQETFRISPTAFALARVLEKDTVLSNYNVKSGTVVLLQNMIACSIEKNGFQNPEVFNPNRWIDSAGGLIPIKPASIVQPFGSGKRICPGKKFSEMQLTMLVIKLIRTFVIKYESPFDRQFEFILAPKGPVDISFIDRN
ncbi:unnamed protein product [Diamesa serratosioi]